MVEPAVAVGPRAGHQLGDERAERHHDTGLAGRGGDDAEVLVVQVDPESRIERPVEHVLLLLVQHLRAGQPAAEHLERGLGVDAVRLEEDDGLGERLDVGGDDQLVGRLDGLARSRSGRRARRSCRPRRGSGLAASKSSAVAADHDRQRGVDRAGLAAGDRGVEEPEALRRGLLGELGR